MRLLLLLVLGGCTFTYTPIVREARVPEPRLVITEPSELVQNETSLQLNLSLAVVPEADWLAVQWFSPGNDEVAAESVWLEPGPGPRTLSVSLPPSAILEPGLWRAVLSYQGRLARQFAVMVSVR